MPQTFLEPDEAAMQVTPYLNFDGRCEAAFTFYAQCLGGRLGPLHRYGGSPMAAQAPAGWDDKVMHGSVVLGDLTLMGADVAPDHYEAPKGFSLSVHPSNTAQAEQIFAELAQQGRVVVPLAATFWAARFGMVVDRFGVSWMINCEA